MLVPPDQPIFENLSSQEYDARAAQLRDGGVDGIVHFTYSGFEEAVVYAAGIPVTGIRETRRWLAAGDDLVDAVENKARAAQGRMSAYRLDPALLRVFAHTAVENTAETALGKYLTSGLLIGYLAGGGGTCILRLQDDTALAYVFFDGGTRVGAAYASAERRSSGDRAVEDAARFRESTSATVYFLKKTAQVSPEAPPPWPLSPPAASPMPVMPASMGPIAPAAIRLPGVKLTVAIGAGGQPGLRHRSRMRVLEALEEGDVAWMDPRAIAELKPKAGKATMVLPDGRAHAISVREASIDPGEKPYIILPRRLRGRLSIAPGTTVEVRA